jgi:hypothetical protein
VTSFPTWARGLNPESGPSTLTTKLRWVTPPGLSFLICEVLGWGSWAVSQPLCLRGVQFQNPH